MQLSVLYNPIFLSSFLAVIGAAIAGSIIGTYIVIKRIVSISGGISHSILGGLGFTLWLQHYLGYSFSPIYGAIISSLVIAFFLGKIHLSYKEREDALIAMIWSIGMAMGIIFISKLQSFNGELINFLLGNILWVSSQDVCFLFLLDVIVITVTCFSHNRFVALCFDEKYMILNKSSPQKWYFILLSLAAITIVSLIYVMGTILMLSMLVLPVSIACRFSNKITHIMGLSILINVLSSTIGICIAFLLDLPVGPTIALIMGGCYAVTLLFNK